MEASIVVESPARAHARGMAGWMKFIGILNIVGGALNALSLVGILWAWLPIWLGIVLLQAGARAGAYGEHGDEASLIEFTSKLRTYFLISGIVAIISIAFVVVAMIAAIVLVSVGGLSLSSLLEYLQNMR